jgi:hypothetical protein
MGRVFKLTVAPFECLLVLRDDGRETCSPHSFMTQISPGAAIHMEGRDWAVVEIQQRLDDVPMVVCRPT